MISSHVISSGGGLATSATSSITYTIGQPLAGVAAAPVHVIQSGYWTGPLIVTSIEGEDAALPVVDKLYPNAPNPFNPRTMIRFDLAEPESSVSLIVYDLRGRRVRTLLHGVLEAGTHQILWDASDSHGASVASGTYYCVLVTPTEMHVARLSLVR